VEGGDGAKGSGTVAQLGIGLSQWGSRMSLTQVQLRPPIPLALPFRTKPATKPTAGVQKSDGRVLRVSDSGNQAFLEARGRDRGLDAPPGPLSGW
jgi:hypothetical protein